ncbi:MAG: hypothetical protein J5U17_03240, partial [Candidatus Methanoperedens sp.]|nr:hypothetical protein [Candidatus Methanoperedens sp.]
IEGNKIKINLTVPTSSSRRYFVYPTESPYKDSIYFGMLKFTSNPWASTGGNGASGSGGGSGAGTKGDPGDPGKSGANCYDSLPDVNKDGSINSQDCLDYIKNSMVQPPPFTTINTSKPYYPLITNIQIEASSGTPDFRKTHANITATVSNMTNRFSIHADLTGLQRDVNIFSYNATPDVILGTPDWSLGKTNTVIWSNIQYPDFGGGANVPIVVSFWASNDVNGLYYTVRAYIYQGGTSWYS